MSKRTKKVFLSLLCFFLLVRGCKFYMDRMKVDNLYRHGFQLYEEQIATYLKENYSGISKIEFSPIFKSGGSGEGFVYARIVPVVYDTYGNKVDLRNDQKESISVESYQNLPDELKLNKDEITNEVMEAFSREGHLKGVEKNDQGSPQAEIVYNLEIRRVQGREFYEWK